MLGAYLCGKCGSQYDQFRGLLKPGLLDERGRPYDHFLQDLWKANRAAFLPILRSPRNAPSRKE